MSIRSAFLASVEAFCHDAGMSPRAFGLAAVNDHRFVARLRAGKGITLTSIEKAERFMAHYGAKDRPDNVMGLTEGQGIFHATLTEGADGQAVAG